MSNARLYTWLLGAASIIIGMTVTPYAFVGLPLAFLFWQLYGKRHDA
ncbi:hypothetical protein [Arthrobacter sp. KNU40]